MPTNDEKLDAEIDEKLDDLDIVRAIEDKDVPYVMAQIRGLIKEARAEGYKEGYKSALFNIDTDAIKKLATTILKILEWADHPATNDEGD